MYSIEKTFYGFRITQVGRFGMDEVERYKADVVRTLARHDQPFSLVLDSRRLVLPTRDVLEVFAQLHEIVWRMSCRRVAIIVESPIARNMAEQGCDKPEMANQDRVIDARKYPDWESRAVAWLVDGVEPEYLPSAKISSVSQ
ncbi:MAG: hypothetical protein OEV49_05550 [candidate division Zixibacteria bacterium]|nr:hypothetical protein [candidate division Zixibacteria bacterium]MDH3936228.1 hypothetical protein [candidate division Zixibacteria bacterium]MDH4032746.1 hypothetical protein [candidate division Zixibacteria bacterium]